MPDHDKHTAFLIRKLGDMGVEVSADNPRHSAQGRLSLTARPFETLEDPFVVEGARFYTLGHNRLKFFEPSPFFELPALDVARCHSSADIEKALRRAWSLSLRQLREARAWLEGLGARVRVTSRGTRLLLGVTGIPGPAAIVRSRAEILLPSAGALAAISLDEPTSRRYRPLRSLDMAVEVELGLTQMMEREVRCAQELADQRARAEADEEPTTAGQEPTRRILVVDDDSSSLAAAENTLRLQNYQVDAFQDPSRALTAFREQSYDLVLADRAMPRIDGLELTVRLRELAGIEKLPIVLVDDRDSEAHQRAAFDAGASAYLCRPLVWSDVGETLEDLLEHVAERRFTRFPLHLSVQPESVAGAGTEMAEDVARGGMRLRTRREIFPGTVEVYKITLPRPLEPVRVEGEVRYRTVQPGQAAILAGIEFRRFIGKCESRWIRLIEALARRAG